MAYMGSMWGGSGTPLDENGRPTGEPTGRPGRPYSLRPREGRRSDGHNWGSRAQNQTHAIDEMLIFSDT